MGFYISVGELPSSVSEFSRHPPKPGSPAVVIKHPDSPWDTSPFVSLESLSKFDGEDLGCINLGGDTICFKETTIKGSTVQADGTVVEHVRPAVAYASDTTLDNLLIGPGDKATDVVYLFPRQR